ncbi:UNVERIFIED_CONTAM: hypothetical protein HDU68_012806 [Siphonaria sp. JEL0065]|nr:hypothetical protein HDU68_012806 [Siphonaria sp. JEL0065]
MAELTAFGREIEAARTGPDPRRKKPKHILDARIPGLEPTYSDKTLKPNTRLVEDGLTKRTITIKGSDGARHRVISYYAREDVIHMYSPPEIATENSSRMKSFITPSDATILKDLLNASSIDWKSLLSESIDMEKYASEIVVAKKQRKEESIKAVARHALAKDSDEALSVQQKALPSKKKKRMEPQSPVNSSYPAYLQHPPTAYSQFPPLYMYSATLPQPYHLAYPRPDIRPLYYSTNFPPNVIAEYAHLEPFSTLKHSEHPKVPEK